MGCNVFLHSFSTPPQPLSTCFLLVPSSSFSPSFPKALSVSMHPLHLSSVKSTFLQIP